MEDPAPRPPQPLEAMRGPASPSSGHARMGRSLSAALWKRVPSLVLVSGIAAAYGATGRLALLLAIPPGYATAIWPRAGRPRECLIGATCGGPSLLADGRIPWTAGLVHRRTWWMGDTIGALVVIPLLLVWTAAPRQVWRRRQGIVVLPLGVAFGLVILFFVHARAVEQARMQLDFERWAHTLAGSVSKVEMTTPMALNCKAFLPSLSTFATPPQ